MTTHHPDTTPTQIPTPVPMARGKRRRGTVLLFALGVLAVISVAAVSYVTFVRVDRNSSSAAARTVGFDRQVDRVVEEIGANLAADLFENKVVTTDVPADIDLPAQSGAPIWPRMFGDGEFRDYHMSNFATFNTDLPGKKGKSTVDNSVLALDQTAPPDDAWLAPIDPLWFRPGVGGDQTHWRQITNLRGTYRYDTNGTPNRLTDDRWVRGDGKFVDLGQVFLDYRTVGSEERGNPGTDLLDKSIFGTGSPNGAVLPRSAAGNFASAPYQVMHFASGDGNPTFTPSDERFWADTDGDLRADARWQLIDSLGTAEGLLWVTATRIVDLSGMVNINAAIEGGYGASQAALYAEGRTPADVDLYRLLLADPDEMTRLGIGSRIVDWGTLTPHGTPSTFGLLGSTSPTGGTFSDHLIQRLRVIDLTNEIDPVDGVLPADFELDANWFWEPNIDEDSRLSPAQRLAIWQAVGSAPGRGSAIESPRGPIQPGYPLTEMIDLHAFSGSNNRSILSKWEQTIDGPDNNNGFLPRPEDQPSDRVGPLRSRTRPGDTRFPGNQATGADTRPAPQQVRGDIRRIMTTVSGVSNVSPVPSINAKAVAWDQSRPYYSRAFNTKISLPNFSIDSIPDAYQAFVWALAPLATDEFLTSMNHAKSGALIGDNINGERLAFANDRTTGYHYGGPDFVDGPSPADLFGLTAGAASVEYGKDSGAAFAVVTAGALATNTVDASDADDEPTVSRLFVPGADETPLRSRITAGRAILGNRFSHGDVPEALVPQKSVGQRADSIDGFEQAADTGDQAGIDDWLLDQDGKGLTIVGAERQPYITEVFAFALFENVGGLNDQVTVKDKTSQVGAVIAIQLANPYQTPLTIGSEYEIVILQPGKDDMAATGLDAPLRFAVPSGVTIDRNLPVTLIYTFYDGAKGDYSTVIGINPLDTGGTEIGTTAEAIDRRIFDSTNAWQVKLVLAADSQALVDANPAFVVPFAGKPLRAALRRQVPGLATTGSTKPAFAVVDYMESADEFFPETMVNTAGSINLRTYFDQAYFQAVGYDFTAIPDGINEFVKIGSGQINGRIGFTSAVSRPMKRANFGGFPAFMVATRPTDIEVFNSDSTTQVFGHAWLVPPNIGSAAVPGDLQATGFPIPLMLTAPGAGEGVRDGSELDQMHELDVATLPLTKLADTITGGIPDRPIGGGWQVFIPNRPLRYVSELHQVCTYAHLCKNNELSNIAAWTTVGQQLRESLAWDFGSASNANTNPYIGTLDPSRFLPTGDAIGGEGGITRDDSLALPLALRVFDCFEALDHPDALAQGRININTAPERVLQVLPMMAPGDSTLNSPLPPSNDRVVKVLQYRDAWDPNSTIGVDFNTYRADLLLSLGENTFNSDFAKAAKIRRHDLSHNPPIPEPPYPYTRGFSTAGELAFLDSWMGAGEVNGFVDPKGFISPLGFDGTDNGANDIDRRLFEGDLGSEVDGVADDPEERLALYRAVSNIVSSRSDVYGAWFILRGYDPKIIEATVVDSGLAPDVLVRTAMDNSDTPFLPAYESRWFVIFDRSNCRTPTDRPRVLLKAQLPSSRP